MFVAIEAFMDAEPCHEQPEPLLRFASFVEGLGTQPVTVTASSLIEDMCVKALAVSRNPTDRFVRLHVGWTRMQA